MATLNFRGRDAHDIDPDAEATALAAAAQYLKAHPNDLIEAERIALRIATRGWRSQEVDIYLAID